MIKKPFLLLILLLVAVGTYSQAPVQGDDWANLLGQRNTSADVARVLNYIGPNGNPKGIKATIQENLLTRLDFYNSDNPWGTDIKKFEGKMPKGIDFTWTIAQCKKALGEGFEFEGEVSGTYVLHKSFELNNTDGYQVNIEFLTGRLNALALIFQPNGAKKFAQDGGENKSGIQGDDFLWLIKKNQYNKTYQDMSLALGPPNYEERQLQIFANGGVEVRLTSQLNVSDIYFFSGGQSIEKGHIKQYQQFKLPMPYGIKFTDTREDVLKKAGPPAQDNGGTMVYKLDYSTTTVVFNGDKVDVVHVSENTDYKFEIPASKAKPIKAEPLTYPTKVKPKPAKEK